MNEESVDSQEKAEAIPPFVIHNSSFLTRPKDGHVRVLPLHVANKIAAGEVVERPASVVKELVENAIDAGAANVKVSLTQGGRKLISVQDDGSGMSRDDAILSLERQATSKILDVGDIERIDTLGFRGEAIPSIASVSRFTITTRRRDEDEGTMLQVNAGTLAEVRAAGCPPGTLVEVRDLFCNVPARRKFLRAYVTEESHVKTIFTIHALAHPALGFTLISDGRELYRLAPSADLRDRVRDLFGAEFLENALTLGNPQLTTLGSQPISVSGFIEKPNLNAPTRRDQYVFVNGRPATAPSITYALREAYPRRQGDSRPAAIVFISMPPDQVDVNVHPTKREVRFRDNTAVKQAVITAVERAVSGRTAVRDSCLVSRELKADEPRAKDDGQKTEPKTAVPEQASPAPTTLHPLPSTNSVAPPQAQPVQVEFAVDPDSPSSKPWVWFKFLAMTDSGYLLIETDSGLVTVNPHAARERIAYEALTHGKTTVASQTLLIPETVRLSPPDFARVSAAQTTIEHMGFKLEPFGMDTFKIDEVPQIIGDLPPDALISTIAHDLAEGPGRRSGERWREELIAKSIARSFAGMSLALDEKGAVRLVEELAACRMPYVCPRGKPIMIFTSTRELNRKFARE